MRLITNTQFQLHAVLVASLLLTAPTTLFAQSGLNLKATALGQKAIAQIQALQAEKAARTPTQRKISSQLLHTRKMRRGEPIAAGVTKLRSVVSVDAAGMTLVHIKATVTPALLNHIQSLGGEVLTSSERYNAIGARIYLDTVEALAAHADVDFVRPPYRAITHKNNTSEGDVAHNAAPARPLHGVDGSGVNVCVLSDSVDDTVRDDLLASGDLPAVTVLEGQAGTGTSEGTAMLEIIFDLAPGADLFFATADAPVMGQELFAQNILDLRDAGCNVIVDDILYPNEPVFQDGIVAQAVNDVTADGVLYFSAAGNFGNLNDTTSGVWEGDYSPIGDPFPFGGKTIQFHDFGGGFNGNGFLPFPDPDRPVILQWSDPMGSSSNDYDLFVVDPDFNVVFQSTDSQNGSQDPIEGISNLPSGHFLVVTLVSGDEPRYLHLNMLGGFLGLATDGQTFGHSAAVDAISVAAVDVSDADVLPIIPFIGGPANPVELFSSDGPRRVFYEADGTPITPDNFIIGGAVPGGAVRQKPDITAADDVATDTPGFDSFSGTSAAAPHAAAIAALLLEADLTRFASPTRSAARVKSAMTSTALDIEAAGIDRDSGVGIVMADSALGSLLSNTVNRTDAAIALLLAKNGTGFLPTKIPLAPSFSDVDIGIAGILGDGVFGSDWIEQLLDPLPGITEGCDISNYCPQAVFTKEQLAIMLWKTVMGATPAPDATGEYNDVPAAHPFAPWIDQMHILNQGWSTGCDVANNYCPKEAVTLGGLRNVLNLAFP